MRKTRYMSLTIQPYDGVEQYEEIEVYITYYTTF